MNLPDADVTYSPNFLSRDESDALFEYFVKEIPWRQDSITIWGKTHLLPRKQQWFADNELTYTWSGIRMEPVNWLPVLLIIRKRLLALTGVDFNTVLANLYRTGDDTVGWHSDDEPELGPEPIIASVSFGATRDFQLRHKYKAELPGVTLPLEHGSLLLMKGQTQRYWKHQLPRRKWIDSARVNLTFRVMGSKFA